MIKFASLFSGGGGADIGAIAAGMVPVCANEYTPEIAAVYVENIGDHMRPGDVLEQNPADWPDMDFLHASPPCPNFSTAKTGAAETPHDIALAVKVSEFIAVKRPRWFTMENVRAYRKSVSFAIIRKALGENGYMYDAPILNVADFGVPQTRERLFLRAVRGGMVPHLPPPVAWVGWYQAIADLLDTLPVSEFADWQLKRLPEDIRNTVVFSHSEITGTGRGEMTGRGAGEPYPTVISGDGHRPSSMARAFIMKGGDLWTPPVNGGEPIYTISASGAEHPNRAFIVDGKPLNYAGDLSITQAETPTPTITSTQPQHPFRAWLSKGRVVKMTPRALARFQSLPDCYKLPAKTSLACRIIGNAVPPKMAEAVFRSLIPRKPSPSP